MNPNYITARPLHAFGGLNVDGTELQGFGWEVTTAAPYCIGCPLPEHEPTSPSLSRVARRRATNLVQHSLCLPWVLVGDAT